MIANERHADREAYADELTRIPRQGAGDYAITAAPIRIGEIEQRNLTVLPSRPARDLEAVTRAVRFEQLDVVDIEPQLSHLDCFDDWIIASRLELNGG